MELEKATIIITGGASGLGAAAARSLREAGAHPVIFDRDGQHGPQTARDLDADFFDIDIANAASVEQAILTVQNKTGAIHGLVHREPPHRIVQPVISPGGTIKQENRRSRRNVCSFRVPQDGPKGKEKNPPGVRVTGHP